MLKKRLIVINILLFMLFPAFINALRYKTRTTFSIKSDFKSRPTFSKGTLHFVDRGKMIYIGRSANWDKPYIYLYDLVRFRKIRKFVPIEKFFRKNTHLLVDGQLKKRRKYNSYYISKLFFYDRTQGLAGVEVRNNIKYGQEERYIFLYWDLRKNKIKKAIILSKAPSYTYYTYITGYDYIKKTCYITRYEPKIIKKIDEDNKTDNDDKKNDDDSYKKDDDNDSHDDDSKNNDDSDHKDNDSDSEDEDDAMFRTGPVDIVTVASRRKKKDNAIGVYAVTESGFKRIARIIPNNRISKIRFNLKLNRIFIAEYTEKYMKRKAYGYLIHINSAKIKRMPVPSTPYGITFGPKGRRMYVASAETGYVWAINASTGRRIKKAYGWSRGHVMGFVKPGLLLWLRNASFVFFKTPSLKRVNYISTRKFYKGFCHIEGSLIQSNRVILKNGDKVKILDF